jgi:hypothetical protein
MPTRRVMDGRSSILARFYLWGQLSKTGRTFRGRVMRGQVYTSDLPWVPILPTNRWIGRASMALGCSRTLRREGHSQSAKGNPTSSSSSCHLDLEELQRRSTRRRWKMELPAMWALSASFNEKWEIPCRTMYHRKVRVHSLHLWDDDVRPDWMKMSYASRAEIEGVV